MTILQLQLIWKVKVDEKFLLNPFQYFIIVTT